MSWKDDRHVELNLSAIFTHNLLNTTILSDARTKFLFALFQQLYREIQGKVFEIFGV